MRYQINTTPEFAIELQGDYAFASVTSSALLSIPSGCSSFFCS